MKCRVLGVKRLDYISKKSGQPVKGLSVHIAFKDPEVFGECVAAPFLSINLGQPLLDSINPGDLINIEYNRFGYVAAVEKLTSATPAK